MEAKKCAIFLFDTYADWEPALAIVGLKNYGSFAIDSFSVNGNVVTSMGGLHLKPSHRLDQINPQEYELLLLPGGELWEKGGNVEIIPLLEEFHRAGKTIAAICGATVVLAKTGLLNTTPHTSNMPGYLQQLAPEYQGTDFYRQSPCVRSGNIITANGAGMVEFATELYKTFEIMDELTIDKVEVLYKSGGMDNRLFA